MSMISNRKRTSLSDAEDDGPKRPKFSYTLLENEIQSLRAELEHERSLRELDQRRAAQVQSRLQREVKFAIEDAEEAKQMLEDLRNSSEEHSRMLRDGRQEAISELRLCQAQLLEAQSQQGANFDASKTHGKVIKLESQLEAYKQEIELLKVSLKEATSQIEDYRRKSEDLLKSEIESKVTSNESCSAPKPVLQELNRVRISLAESERKYRQLSRKSDEWNKKAHQLSLLKETSAADKHRISKLEQETKELHRELEKQRALMVAWEDFEKKMGDLLNVSFSGPPEVSSVLRHLQKQIQQTKKMEEDVKRLENSLEVSKEKLELQEKESRDAQTANLRLQRSVQDLKKELDSANMQLRVLRAQEHIWQREAEGLRSLLKSFNEALSTQPIDGEAKICQLALTTAREEALLFKQDHERLTIELQNAMNEKKRIEEEHNRVLDKFTKLRDALMSERKKSEIALDRAAKAESFAGKGLFNRDITRALHLEKNPLSDAIRERYQNEIKALKRRIEESNVCDSLVSSGNPAKPDVDPEKLHQRLKDTFKEQIGIFREGVYLITGFKIDMHLDKATPYFKVRSVYGEREEDVLIFNWPKNVKQPKSLDLRANDFARVLSTTDAYQYLTKYDSMPGFMASTQLTLLEKCTFVTSGNS
jgi:myosin heavy subunit